MQVKDGKGGQVDHGNLIPHGQVLALIILDHQRASFVGTIPDPVSVFFKQLLIRLGPGRPLPAGCPKTAPSSSPERRRD
jgi:hypothetical protein